MTFPPEKVCKLPISSVVSQDQLPDDQDNGTMFLRRITMDEGSLRRSLKSRQRTKGSVSSEVCCMWGSGRG